MKKINLNENDPMKYLNKKHDHKFLFISSWNLKKEKKEKIKVPKILKTIGLLSLPVASIVLGTTLGIITSFNNSSLPNQVVINTEVVKRRIYLISDDNYTVPLTVSLDKKNNIHEEMLDVINLLKVSSKASNEYLHGFLSDECRVNSFTFDNNDLTIDFSKEFYDYKDVDKVKALEALTSSILQFDNVSSLSISVDGEYIDNNKYNQSTLPLNIRSSHPSLMENKELVTVFYERKYDVNNKYLIPVSLYANKGESDNITYVNGLFKELPSSYQLENLTIYNNISMSQSTNDEFTLNVNATALVDEVTVSKDLYDIVMLSLDLMGKEEKVNFEIEGETLMVEGIYDEGSVPVSSIYYNETQI